MSMNPKVPAVVSVGLVCLVLGAGAGAVLTTMYGSLWGAAKPAGANAPEEVSPDDVAAKMGQGGGQQQMMGKGGFGKGGFGKGKGKGKGKGGPNGAVDSPVPTPRSQLATLVTKLDQLTRKPLQVTLSDEQKADLAKQLDGLEKMDRIDDDEAKKRLGAIRAIVEHDWETLAAAGFPNRPPPADAPNPFKEGSAAEHLKALRERIGKSKD